MDEGQVTHHHNSRPDPVADVVEPLFTPKMCAEFVAATDYHYVNRNLSTQGSTLLLSKFLCCQSLLLSKLVVKVCLLSNLVCCQKFVCCQSFFDVKVCCQTLFVVCC